MARSLHPNENNAQKKRQVIEEFSYYAGANGMIHGQVMDITLSPENTNEDNIEELIMKKTGCLILASVKAGAILGDASPSQLKAIVEYGENIGVAFQIRDDIHDALDLSEEIRPNYVSVFGLDESKQKVKDLVDAGLKALEKTHLESETLRHLACALLESEGKEK
jgi:geranylgeranyl diphosphate synthase type II